MSCSFINNLHKAKGVDCWGGTLGGRFDLFIIILKMWLFLVEYYCHLPFGWDGHKGYLVTVSCGA